MSAYQTNEPYLDFVERAGLGRRFHFFPDVILTYDSRSGSYDVENGTIVETSSELGQSTTLTVESDNGYQFTVTRGTGGVYYTDSLWTWVAVTRYYIE